MKRLRAHIDNAHGCLGIDIRLRRGHIVDVVRHRKQHLRIAGHMKGSRNYKVKGVLSCN